MEEEMAALVEAEGGGDADAPGTSRGGGRGGGGSGGAGGEEGSREGSDEEGSDGEGPAPGELLAREAAGVPLNEAQRREAEVLRAAGITGGWEGGVCSVVWQRCQRGAVVGRCCFQHRSAGGGGSCLMVRGEAD